MTRFESFLTFVVGFGVGWGNRGLSRFQAQPDQESKFMPNDLEGDPRPKLSVAKARAHPWNVRASGIWCVMRRSIVLCLLAAMLGSPPIAKATLIDYGEWIEQQSGGGAFEKYCISAAITCLTSKNPARRIPACGTLLFCGAIDISIWIGCLPLLTVEDSSVPHIGSQLLAASVFEITNTRDFDDVFYVETAFFANLNGSGPITDPSWGYSGIPIVSVQNAILNRLDSGSLYELTILAGETATIMMDIYSLGVGTVFYDVFANNATFFAPLGSQDVEQFEAIGLASHAFSIPNAPTYMLLAIGVFILVLFETSKGLRKNNSCK